MKECNVFTNSLIGTTVRIKDSRLYFIFYFLSILDLELGVSVTVTNHHILITSHKSWSHNHVSQKDIDNISSYINSI